ncbi:hypothetical protein J6590_035047 [Homalodisca vitripennis]|nr:hypothetical protein J6590_035047 [Homalodisca vitripennis]
MRSDLSVISSSGQAGRRGVQRGWTARIFDTRPETNREERCTTRLDSKNIRHTTRDQQGGEVYNAAGQQEYSTHDQST